MGLEWEWSGKGEVKEVEGRGKPRIEAIGSSPRIPSGL